MNWDTYGRTGVDIASNVTSLAFSSVKGATKLGFSLTRAIATGTAGLTGSVVDKALFGGNTVTSPILGNAVHGAFSFVEKLTMAPIHFSEYITTTSLFAAHSSINALSAFFPGSSDASFSLASFITLIRRHWNDPTTGEYLPAKQHGLAHVARATVAWATIQGATQEWQERRWMAHLQELHLNAPPRRQNVESLRRRRGSRVRVTSDVILPGAHAQIIAADIGCAVTAAPPRAQSIYLKPKTRAKPIVVVSRLRPLDPVMSLPELKATLRRLSKLVLAGYGGASLLFFGVSPSTAHGSTSANAPSDNMVEQRQLATAIEASEAEAAGDFDAAGEAVQTNTQYSWWDVLLGKHDQEIFERAANSPDEVTKGIKEQMARTRTTAVIGSEHLMPRFWVLTDHSRRQVVLVLRGTMSLNEIAADLTCEPAEFTPARTTSQDTSTIRVPGGLGVLDENATETTTRVLFPTISTDDIDTDDGAPVKYHAHSGMLRLAHAMGDIGKPVQVAVQEALHHNLDYDLVLCGHSLGAGVAALLGLMWADPVTCLTVATSGLPTRRRVSVYCFAPPTVTSLPLCRLARSLVTSFVYSRDVVSRLSLGSMLDLKCAAMWLCEPDSHGTGRLYHSVAAQAVADQDWFVAARTALEANMRMVNMYPPGRVLWAIRDGDLHPFHRSTPAEPNRLRLFEVLAVDKVFNQIVFAKDMLTAHMPHQYDRALHELL
ncbi:alpha/beta-hydrolase [Fistulina hepatica ATCC 64428]|uniref:sn-1-specific diacylglycerol lipase n=1 Tax=Fistulina hepatica ATCC 64428 TaxID=1128425 RepID=A0A0D6ZZ57_9AGAR|nr:alpha/beta-hydrolase [Fistulina hepatica ATCC 64428]